MWEVKKYNLTLVFDNGDENRYYVVYYYVGEEVAPDYQSNFGFMSPIGSSNFRYFAEGISTDWQTTLDERTQSSDNKANFYTSRSTFVEGTVIYLTMDVASGILPPFTNISTNEILEAANHTVNGEQVLCYKIVITQDGNWYQCQEETMHTFTPVYADTRELFTFYNKYGDSLAESISIRDGDTWTFRISYDIKKSNVLYLFDKQSDGTYLIKEGEIPFEVTGATYTYYTNKLGACDSFLYVYITLQEVRDDVSVKVNVEQKNNDFAFKIEEGYSIYIDDALVTDEVGETVLVNVTFKSVLTLVPDDGFIFIDVNGDSRIVFYQMANGVSTLYQNYALSVASDNSYAYFEFSNFYTLQYGKVAIDASKPVEFLDVMLASHKADNVTQYCASADDLNNITFPDGKPVGVNTDNSLTFSVKLPFGNYPVLFVEYTNRLSDGYYTYQAVSSSQDGDYSIFTFEVTNIDSDVNWFLELRPNVYEVTVHYGDKTDTVTLNHGQILADCDALLSSFEGSFEGQNGLFKVVGWSSEEGGDANVILVAGPDDLWAVTEFVPYTVSFEGQGFTSLSEALKAFKTRQALLTCCGIRLRSLKPANTQFRQA